jgi:hypothetical protein
VVIKAHQLDIGIVEKYWEDVTGKSQLTIRSATKAKRTRYNVCAHYGDGIDHTTGNIHGRLLVPRENQVVLLLFEDDEPSKPYAVCPLPYDLTKTKVDEHRPSKLFETDSGGTYDDIIDSHSQGQRIIKRQDGKIEIQSKVVSGNRTTIIMDENGNVDIALNPATAMKVNAGSGLQALIDERCQAAFNRHIHISPAGNTAGPIDPLAVPPTSPMVWKNKNAVLPGEVAVGTDRP